MREKNNFACENFFLKSQEEKKIISLKSEQANVVVFAFVDRERFFLKLATVAVFAMMKKRKAPRFREASRP